MMKHASLTLTQVKLYERPKLNSEPIRFLTFANDGEAFLSLGSDYMIPFCRDEILSRFGGIPSV